MKASIARKRARKHAADRDTRPVALSDCEITNCKNFADVFCPMTGHNYCNWCHAKIQAVMPHKEVV